MLSVAGAIAGVAIAWWSTSALVRFAPADFMGDRPIALDARVLLFALAVSIVSGLAFGVVPALQLSRDALSGALAEGGARSSGTRRAGRTRDVLVAIEIAVAVVLLTGSTLFVRSFRSLTRVDVGIDTHNLLTFDINLTGDRARDPVRRVMFFDALRQRLSQVPGVRAVSAAVTLPIGGDSFGITYLPEGKRFVDLASLPGAGFQIVTPGYFAAMGIPIEAGRDVEPSDTPQSEPVALVNERLAHEAWPGRDPIGKRLKFNPSDADWIRVIGVVADIRHNGPASAPRPEIYQPHSQRSFPFMAFVVRTAGDPHAIVPSLRGALAELDPALPLANARTMDEHIERAVAKPRFFSTLVGAFGLLAVTLALVGIYAMMAWSVSERRQEFAIRLALGAGSSVIARMVVLRALTLAAIGIAVGLGAARALTSLVASLLYGVRPDDPASFVWTALVVAAVALLACSVPVRRALRTDPLSLLR